MYQYMMWFLYWKNMRIQIVSWVSHNTLQSFETLKDYVDFHSLYIQSHFYHYLICSYIYGFLFLLQMENFHNIQLLHPNQYFTQKINPKTNTHTHTNKNFYFILNHLNFLTLWNSYFILFYMYFSHFFIFINNLFKWKYIYIFLGGSIKL